MTTAMTIQILARSLLPSTLVNENFRVRCECLPRLDVQLKGTIILSRCRRF